MADVGPRPARRLRRRALPRATRCSARPGVADFDPTRLTVSACDLGLTGYELETALRDDYRIAVEAADPLNIVLNVTFGDSRDDVELLVGALRDLAARYAASGPARRPPPAPTLLGEHAAVHAPGARARATPSSPPSVAHAARALRRPRSAPRW